MDSVRASVPSLVPPRDGGDGSADQEKRTGGKLGFMGADEIVGGAGSSETDLDNKSGGLPV